MPLLPLWVFIPFYGLKLLPLSFHNNTKYGDISKSVSNPLLRQSPLLSIFNPCPENATLTCVFNIFFYWRYNILWVYVLQPFSGAIASSRTRFLDHTQIRATVGRTPLDEWSVHRRDLYLTTHTTQNRQASMSPVRTQDCSRWAAIDLHLRERGYWDRRL
jgi:hypothetical protein